jgi:hypothetical protein
VLGDGVQFARALARARLREATRIAFGTRADIHDDFFLDDLRAFAGEAASYAASLFRRG